MGIFVEPGSNGAEVVELVDALDSKSSGRKPVWVRLPPSAPERKKAPAKAGAFFYGNGRRFSHEADVS